MTALLTDIRFGSHPVRACPWQAEQHGTSRAGSLKLAAGWQQEGPCYPFMASLMDPAPTLSRGNDTSKTMRF